MFLYQLCIKYCVVQDLKTTIYRPTLPGAYDRVGKIA